MFKLATAVAVTLALISCAAAAAAADVSAAEDAVVRNYGSLYTPKCYITYKKCCSYKKAVYGKCYKKVCYKDKVCKNSYHAAGASEAAAGEAVDASVKNTYGGGGGGYGYGKGRGRGHRAPRKSCYYVDKCSNKGYDCIKKYDEGYHCDGEKKKYGYSDW